MSGGFCATGSAGASQPSNGCEFAIICLAAWPYHQANVAATPAQNVISKRERVREAEPRIVFIFISLMNFSIEMSPVPAQAVGRLLDTLGEGANVGVRITTLCPYSVPTSRPHHAVLGASSLPLSGGGGVTMSRSADDNSACRSPSAPNQFVTCSGNDSFVRRGLGLVARRAIQIGTHPGAPAPIKSIRMPSRCAIIGATSARPSRITGAAACPATTTDFLLGMDRVRAPASTDGRTQAGCARLRAHSLPDTGCPISPHLVRTFGGGLARGVWQVPRLHLRCRPKRFRGTDLDALPERWVTVSGPSVMPGRELFHFGILREFLRFWCSRT
jgi:hypothetical protein